MSKNAFGMDIPEIRELLKDAQVRVYATRTLCSILDTLGIRDESISERAIELASSYTDLSSYEREAHGLLAENDVIQERISQALRGRAEQILSQIRGYLQGETVLELGCGDGKVGERISKEGFDVTLADIYEHPHASKTGLDFILFGQKDKLRIGKFDTTLLLTVLHHSSYPMLTLQNAIDSTRKGGRVIVIESVYGIGKPTRELCSAGRSGEITEKFKLLPPGKQMMANMFLDHFYNRVIYYSEDPAKKVNIPFNFRRPEGPGSWEEIFRQHGLKSLAVRYLGIDHSTVPEYHTLHVLEVI